MPSREFELRVQDMQTEIAVVVETVAGLNVETFEQDVEMQEAAALDAEIRIQLATVGFALEVG